MTYTQKREERQRRHAEFVRQSIELRRTKVYATATYTDRFGRSNEAILKVDPNGPHFMWTVPSQSGMSLGIYDQSVTGAVGQLKECYSDAVVQLIGN